MIGEYVLTITGGHDGCYEAALTNLYTSKQRQLSIGNQVNLNSACDKAVEAAIESMSGR